MLAIQPVVCVFQEALLQKQSTQRRMQATEAMNYQPPHFAKCVFVDEGLRCNARVVPLSKFCQKRILCVLSL